MSYCDQRDYLRFNSNFQFLIQMHLEKQTNIKQTNLMKELLLVFLLNVSTLCELVLAKDDLRHPCDPFANMATCPNTSSPVCGTSFIFPSRTNYSNECYACNDQNNPLEYYTKGHCSPPSPPQFIDCQEHTVLISKCELITPLQPIMNCVIDKEGKAIIIDSINLCTDFCAPSNILKYIFMDCDYVHEGKTIALWAAQTFDPINLPSIPIRPIEKGYLRCPNITDLICSEDNSLVCGVINEDTQYQFDNYCRACANTSIVGYAPGKCSKVEPPPHVICKKQTRNITVNYTENCVPNWVCVFDNVYNNMYMDLCLVNPCYQTPNLLYINDFCQNIYEGLQISEWGIKLVDKLLKGQTSQA